MAENLEVTLLKMKKTVEDARTEHARAEGRRDELLRQLKETYKVDSVEEAETLLDQMEAEEKALQEQIEISVENLRAKMFKAA